MPILLSESQILNDMATLLRDFLPGTFNNNYTFPIAAENVGVKEYWQMGGSKRPAILYLLENTLQFKKNIFPNLIVEIVKLSISWRIQKNNPPLTRDEVNQLNNLGAGID